MTTINELQYALRMGLSMVREAWSYKAKGWVTGIWAADIDSDGDTEIVAGSKDGRVYVLTKDGDERWKRIVGKKAPVETIVAIPPVKGRENMFLDASNICARVLVGTRDGKVYAFDKDGNGVASNRQQDALEDNGNGSIESSPDNNSWYSSSHVLRNIYMNLEQSNTIFIGSEDRCVHALDYSTGEEQQLFETQGWVRAIYICNADGDEKSKILVGSDDKHIYILDQNGTCINKKNIQSQIHALFTLDIDGDGQEEILLGTDGKDLVVLTSDLHEEKWSHHFPRRLLAVYAADLNNDGYAEILVSSEDKYLYILDHEGKQIWKHPTDYRIFSLYAADVHKEGQVEVFAGGEDRICAFQFAIIKDMEKEIRRSYQVIEKSSHKEKSSPDPLKNLSVPERTLLQHVIGTDARKPVTMKRVEQQMERQEYIPALSGLLRLKQQKMQILWQREIYKGLETRGHVRALCLGNISGDTQLEVIVGTDDGYIHAFTASGRLLWSLPLDGQVVSMQTGYLDSSQWAEIVVCSTNDRLYIVNSSNSKRQKRYQPKIKIEKKVKWVSSHYINTQTRYLEILIGTEDKKIYVCKDNVNTLPDHPIKTVQGIKILCLYEAHSADDPEIIAGSNENRVYAYTRKGALLWEYETRDRIQAICVRDIDNDGQAEILIGSEDCNIHVINGRGHFQWRYYLPHRVLSIDCAPINRNSCEIFVGCGDGYLYVFNQDGDLLRKYQAKDLIRAVCIDDINKDRQLEIILGSEDQLEALQVVDPEQVQALIDECLHALQSREGRYEAIHNLQRERDAVLRAFAAQKQLEQTSDNQTALDLLKEMLDDNTIEVRKVLIQEVMSRYASFPEQACFLLDQLATIPEQEVRLAFIDSLDVLMRHNHDIAYNYLMNFAGNTDRFVRRGVVRKMHQLISDKQIKIKKEVIFDMLLLLTKKKDSEWVQQEAARTLAHFFDSHHEFLLAYVYRLIVKGTKVEIFRHIGFNAKKELVQKSMEVLLFLIEIEKFDEINVLEVLEKVVPLLATMQQIKYGKDTWTIYKELQHLFTYRTVEAIAQYRCTLPLQPATEANQHFIIVAPIFRRLSIISRSLQLYVRRNDINDRFPVLMETLDAIEAVQAYIEKQYSHELFGEKMERLPDRQIFLLLLQRWRALVQAQLHRLKGKAELVAELQTKITRQEKLVGIWLVVHNHGRISANNIQITLLHSDKFEIIGKNTHETDVIFAGEAIRAEFTITPYSNSLDLVFEIAYDESTSSLSQMRVITFGDRLELQTTQRVFRDIPNPYSPGIPALDNTMCYGRDTEITFLRENLTRTTAKTVLVLYGQRRSGKTTLLLQLTHTPMMEKHIPVFFNMQEVSYKISDSKLFYKLAFQLSKSLEKLHIVPQLPDRQDFEADPTFAFTLFLDALESRLQGRKIIFLIDEFEVLEEQVKKGHLDPEIFEYLRSLMQHRSYINVLLSGTHQIKQLTQEYWSVFFNTALHYRLKKLSEKGAYDLIQLPVEEFLEYERHAVIKIRQLTGDQPYLIQLLCHALVNHCNELRKSYVTVNDINSVLYEVMQTGEIHFDWLWEQLSSSEQIALSALAEGSKDEGRFLSFVDIQDLYSHHQLPCKQEHIEARFQALHDADIIERADDKRYTLADYPRFRISVGLMRIWLRKEKSLTTVLEANER